MLLRLLFSLFVLSLSACSKKPSDANFDYYNRLSSQIDLPSIANYQDSKKLEAVIFESLKSETISVIELAKLQHCELGQIIADHNSQLGKVATSSALFRYQIKFIQHAPSCLHSQLNEEIERKLSRAVAIKERTLEQYWVSMIFNDPQLSKLYLASSVSMQQINEEDKQSTKLLLSYLANVKRHIQLQEFEQIDIESLETHLAKLHRNTHLASLLRGLYEQVELTNKMTKILQTIELESLCKPNQNHQKANIMATVFNKFYASAIQAYQSKLLTEYQYIQEDLTALWSNFQNEPLISNRDIHPLALDDALKNASVAHVRWWQDMYKQCKIQAGK